MTDFAAALENVKRMASNNPKDEYMQKFTQTAKGSFVGMIGGLMVGWYYKKSLYVYGLLGTVIGGGINYLLFQEENK
jgi:hypothetical protein